MHNPALVFFLMRAVLASGRWDTATQPSSLGSSGLPEVVISLSVRIITNVNLKKEKNLFTPKISK